jgi:hypothetical protein
MKYYKENFVQSTKAGSLRVIDFSQATPKSTNVEAKYFYLEKPVFYYKANLFSRAKWLFPFVNIALYHVSKSGADKGKSRFARTKLNLSCGKVLVSF